MVVVPDAMTPSEANARYGERYGVDWSYAEAATQEET